MAGSGETCDDSLRAPQLAREGEPGVIAVFAAGRPAAVACRTGPEGVDIGREGPVALLRHDDRVSRRHVWIARVEEGWQIEDRGSRNGTFVDGQLLTGGAVFGLPVLVRIGRSLLWTVDDVTPFAGQLAAGDPGSSNEGPVIGGMLRAAFGAIAIAARAGDTLCILGESGSGKEIAARAFHEARHGALAGAPFVAVNCAAIPEGLAERLLFGARKGAYSGATADADGYVQAAHGGTLFLDEIAELDPLVQAKLLRVLETREVLPLGAARPKRVEIGVCVASHKGLRAEVTAGRFREDLYFRIGRPEVRIPPLRERVDEIPWLVARELSGVDPRLTASATFVEACALRPWPGNVRELLSESRRAAHAALEVRATTVEPAHLAPDAGLPLAPSAAATGGAAERPPAGDPPHATGRPSDEQIRAALEAHAGNVRGTARSLGMHRNQLRRWLAKQPSGR
jgi:transcriptional regulator of acetoin/glycerol metabolism